MCQRQTRGGQQLDQCMRILVVFDTRHQRGKSGVNGHQSAAREASNLGVNSRLWLSSAGATTTSRQSLYPIFECLRKRDLTWGGKPQQSSRRAPCSYSTLTSGLNDPNIRVFAVTTPQRGLLFTASMRWSMSNGAASTLRATAMRSRRWSRNSASSGLNVAIIRGLHGYLIDIPSRCCKHADKNGAGKVVRKSSQYLGHNNACAQTYPGTW